MINICARQILFQKQCVVRLLDINHIHFRAITFYCSSFRLSFLILLNHIDDDLPLLHFFFFLACMCQGATAISSRLNVLSETVWS